MITLRDKNIFISFLNESGYVLDFNNQNFDAFTFDSIGVAVRTEYSLSKGKSLEAYIRDSKTSDKDAEKLLLDLIHYYEDNLLYKKDKEANNDRYKKYIQCIEVLSRWDNLPQNFQIVHIKQVFDSAYISNQIDLMTRLQEESPTDAIGKAKELIESCCITILDKLEINYDKEKENLNKLATKTFQSLKIMPDDVPDSIKDVDIMKKLLGNLLAITQSIAALRNNYGSGHGKSASFSGLQPRHAKLAVGASITLVNFLWDSFNRNPPKNF